MREIPCLYCRRDLLVCLGAPCWQRRASFFNRIVWSVFWAIVLGTLTALLLLVEGIRR